MQPSQAFDLSGRVALVTGGQGTLGSQYVSAFVQAGMRVGIVDIKDSIHPLVQGLIDSGEPIIHATADIKK